MDLLYLGGEEKLNREASLILVPGRDREAFYNSRPWMDDLVGGGEYMHGLPSKLYKENSKMKKADEMGSGDDDARKDHEQVIGTKSGSTDDNDDNMDDVEEEVGDDDNVSSPQSSEDPADVEEEQQDLRPRMCSGEEYGLPPGWLVEERPRASGKLKGVFDKYYYEPESNRLFRSMKKVKQHLQIVVDPQPSRRKVKKGAQGDLVDYEAGSSFFLKGRGRGRRASSQGRSKGYGPLSKPILRPFARGTTMLLTPIDHRHSLPPHHRVVFAAKSDDNKSNDNNKENNDDDQ